MNIDSVIKKKLQAEYKKFRETRPSNPLPKTEYSKVKMFSDEELSDAIFHAQETAREFPGLHAGFLTALYKERKAREK